jgi:hypothetical protein
MTLRRRGVDSPGSKPGGEGWVGWEFTLSEVAVSDFSLSYLDPRSVHLSSMWHCYPPPPPSGCVPVRCVVREHIRYVGKIKEVPVFRYREETSDSDDDDHSHSGEEGHIGDKEQMAEHLSRERVQRGRRVDTKASSSSDDPKERIRRINAARRKTQPLQAKKKKKKKNAAAAAKATPGRRVEEHYEPDESIYDSDGDRHHCGHCRQCCCCCQIAPTQEPFRNWTKGTWKARLRGDKQIQTLPDIDTSRLSVDSLAQLLMNASAALAYGCDGHGE